MKMKHFQLEQTPLISSRQQIAAVSPKNMRKIDWSAAINSNKRILCTPKATAGMKFYLQNMHIPDLHRAVEKQDYNTFLFLLRDRNTNVHCLDHENYNKARYYSVIFSAFHKILYSREKLTMRRYFAQIQSQYKTGLKLQLLQQNKIAPNELKKQINVSINNKRSLTPF